MQKKYVPTRAPDHDFTGAHTEKLKAHTSSQQILYTNSTKYTNGRTLKASMTALSQNVLPAQKKMTDNKKI